MRIDVLTLFPEVFEPFVSTSIVGRAAQAGLVTFRLTNFREFATDKHRTVDDRPFGGGAGMVLMCGPIVSAVEHLAASSDEAARPILLTPQGPVLTQAKVMELSQRRRIVLVCGHYEGFDERIRESLDAEEISIGDYVLSGGEPAAMVLIDAVVRLIPGAVGNEFSPADESFSTAGLLEYPQYTRPREFRGLAVPEVLISGHHADIERWRREQAVSRTRERRPDLMDSEQGG